MAKQKLGYVIQKAKLADDHLYHDKDICTTWTFMQFKIMLYIILVMHV